MDYKKVPQQINDVVGDNVKKLAQLFPSAVKDGEVDFEALKEELGSFVEVGAEKYELTWAGKADAKRIAREDIIGKTLKYIPEDSKDAETTENLYIEGDNLEVLKLLRQNYYGAIKMIYIDPPYNTGNDFVYNDNFNIEKRQSDIETGDMSDDGERFSVNLNNTNRFHAKWLSNVYSRIKVAKDLLTDDGVLFISIGDEEQSNLKMMVCEIFGERNFIAVVSRVAKTTSFKGNHFAPSKDYLLVVAKNIDAINHFTDEVDNSQFKKVEVDGPRKGEKYRDDIAFYLSTLDITRGSWSQRYWIECPDGSKVIPPGKTFPPQKGIAGDGVWRWTPETFEAKKDYIVFKATNRSPLLDENGNQAKWNLYTKSYLKDKENSGNVPRDFWEKFLNRNGSERLKKLNIPFDYAKPYEMLMYIFKIIQLDKEAIVLDFFSGSATTADAVMEFNAADAGNRKFIMVQYPEECSDNSKARVEGYETICDIAKERIRRAGDKIKQENPDNDIDIGFKVFRVADTNIKWNSLMDMGQLDVSQIESTPDLMDFMPNTKDIDVVYELMLRQRDVALSESVELLSDIGSRTYLYASSFLVCLETEVTESLVEKIAAIDPLPIKFIFRDSAFKDDIALKDETFRRLKALVEKNSGESKPTYTVEFI